MIYSKVDKLRRVNSIPEANELLASGAWMLKDVLQHQDSWNFLLVHKSTNENEFHLRPPRPMN